ncbi:hypothetical protein [Lacrimispora sp.]|uniref:hypothetical protein n=1 Tax=Lacrimispora sp. TaxID=2719234 RepID=UPI002FD8D7EF
MNKIKMIFTFLIISIVCLALIFIYGYSPYTYEWNGCSISFPDRSWKKVMSGDSSVAGFTSVNNGSVEIICTGFDDPAKNILLYPRLKEQAKKILEDKQIGKGYEVFTLSFSNDDVSKEYESSFGITGSDYKHGLLKGIETPEQTYQILILMNRDDAKSVESAHKIMDSIIVIP